MLLKLLLIHNLLIESFKLYYHFDKYMIVTLLNPNYQTEKVPNPDTEELLTEIIAVHPIICKVLAGL